MIGKKSGVIQGGQENGGKFMATKKTEEIQGGHTIVLLILLEDFPSPVKQIISSGISDELRISMP